MEQSCSQSGERSVSPTHLLEQLEFFQLLQRNNLIKHSLDAQKTPDSQSSVTEIVSHFSGSTSYNTFRSLLQSSSENNNNEVSRQNISQDNISQKLNNSDLIDGVAILNLSQESEFIVGSSASNNTKITNSCKNKSSTSLGPPNLRLGPKYSLTRKAIELDEMPILSPKKDFDALVVENLDQEKSNDYSSQTSEKLEVELQKKAFLKRGDGMSRFGIKKKDLIIQSIKSLPWNMRYGNNKSKADVSNKVVKKKKENPKQTSPKAIQANIHNYNSVSPAKVNEMTSISQPQQNSNINKFTKPALTVTNPDSKTTSLQQKSNHPLLTNKGKTWGSVLTKEQDEYLRQLKQSNYYKNFASPAKSTLSDMSGDDEVRGQRELAEQNMFDLLEEKATQENFNLDNSFLYRFLQRAALENSGDSTPIVLQKCLDRQPELLQIFPCLKEKNTCDVSIQSDGETCCSEYTECNQDCCSSKSTCCSCNTVEETPSMKSNNKNQKTNQKTEPNKNDKLATDKAAVSKPKENTEKTKCHDASNVDETIKTNMAEMNAKLIATSEIFKDRLKELEDEIEMFRKENSKVNKMRDDMESERQKFYEEKSSFEQKFNEEKILSEYYLAEEKEKLVKQKKIYEKYVREIRGRLNKKEKDEVVQLKNEIAHLKEEIRIKDAKSTCTIARQRNQIKIMEKEKKELQDEVEKLKKENRRIQHSNEMTRRLTNIKYLEQINKKLTTISNEKVDINPDRNVKYKAFEIERQSRKRTQEKTEGMRPRSKSVPNVNVTSRYAKYFSQRDAFSQVDREKGLNLKNTHKYTSEDEELEIADQSYEENNSTSTSCNDDMDTAIDEANNLEKLYMERFNSNEVTNDKLSPDKPNAIDDYFLRKGATNPRLSHSPLDKGSSPNHLELNPSSITRSPVSILSNKPQNPPYSRSNRSSISRPRSNSPEPTTVPPVSPPQAIGSSFPSQLSLSKATLTPREIRQPDGTKELRFPNGNVKYISADGIYSKFVYYNGDVKENFYNEGRIKYFFAETKTCHTTFADGLEVLEFADGQIERRYKDGSSEVRLPNGSVRYHDPKNIHVREEWRFPDGTRLTMAANGEQRVEFVNGQVEVHAKDHKRREFRDGTVKVVYNDGTSETRYASGRVRVKDQQGNVIMDSAPR